MTLRRALAAFACLASLALASVTLAATPFEIFKDSTLNKVVTNKKLVVGMEMKYFPFEYVDKDGKPVGYDVDIAKLIAEELKVEIEFKDMEWTGLIPALQAGKIDLIISGMTATLERAKTITFSDPYFVTGLTALLSNKKAPDVKKVEELNKEGVVLAVKTGTTGDLVATKKFPKATINRFKDETACVMEVVNGRADAFFYDQLSVAKHQKENAAATRAILEPFTYEPFGIAIRKGDFDFHDWLNQFLATIKADGRMDELKAKHFKELLGGK